MRYFNSTRATKTFYGVTFKPGETHTVPGYINVDGFYPVTTTPAPISEVQANVKEQVEVEVKPTRGRKSKDGEN